MAFSQREARSLIRKAVNRVPEGEDIRHLNIMPMMDMMTILLVAFIFQAAASAELLAQSVSLPKSLSDDEMQENATNLIITKSGIVVEGRTIVPVANGDVDAADKEGGALGVKIPKLTDYLAKLHQIQEAERMKKANPGDSKVPELMVFADRSAPFNLLVEVMYSAKQKEAGFKRFRLIVQKSYPVHK
jgi:biopolymer transport protein ExbD